MIVHKDRDAKKPETRWTPARPNALVVACSDGRLQEATDAFLAREFKITRYDRFYVPGGGGALASSGTDQVRAQQMCAECKYLVELHAVRRVIVLFHGPSAAGRIEAACADYRRKLPWANIAELRTRQELDAVDLLARRREFASEADVLLYRCEADAAGALTFVNLDPQAQGREAPISTPGRRPAR
jgi:carbonic anhydrase